MKARKGKRKTVDENKFEIKLYENILQLADDIMSKEYSPSRGICFVTHRPVIREIFGAPFRDRVVFSCFPHSLVKNASWMEKQILGKN